MGLFSYAAVWWGVISPPSTEYLFRRNRWQQGGSPFVVYPESTGRQSGYRSHTHNKQTTFFGTACITVALAGVDVSFSPGTAWHACPQAPLRAAENGCGNCAVTAWHDFLLVDFMVFSLFAASHCPSWRRLTVRWPGRFLLDRVRHLLSYQVPPVINKKRTWMKHYDGLAATATATAPPSPRCPFACS